jgi:hypothetical protein
MAREVRRHNDPVRLALVAVATLAALSLLASSASAGGGGSESSLQFGYGKDVRYARAIKFCNVYRAETRLRECLTKQLFDLVLESHDSAHELPRIDAYVASAGGYLQRSCHVLMHGVGRRYAAAVHVTIGRLLDYLPHTNDANCSAGFGHGLLMYLAPQIGSLSPDEAAKACNGAPTRYQRYSCTHGFGHAYMRLYGEQLPFALHACKLLGAKSAADCAAGAFHDYWIAVAGLDNARHLATLVTSPRKLCATSAGGFVRGCWYRALLERPPPKPVNTAADVRSVCRGLTGLQHGACVTAAVVVSADDPFAEMDLCVALRGADAANCVRGVRVPDLAQAPGGQRLKLIRRCAHVDHAEQATCYRWLGLALNVVTNGRFATKGCPALRFASTRDACKAGAAAYDGPLETFS